jgi:ribonucleoside-triphosphate reductase (formate)
MQNMTPARVYAAGIGDAVADRTINRKLDPETRLELEALPHGVKDTRAFVRETWEEVALRVAEGNTLLHPKDAAHEFSVLHRHLRQASVLMSGRHLQHGDTTQPSRNQEVFTNCSTSAMSLVLFYLLLNGSGVGRCYDDDMMLVDWCKSMPVVVPYISNTHKDVLTGEIPVKFTDDFWQFFDADEVIYFEVPDSREGWAKAVEQIERYTYEGVHANKTLVLDFSLVREKGAPIRGMQNRPASGPAPLMQAIANIGTLKGGKVDPFEATMWADHYLAECVLVGGARRAARMATKTWRDRNVLRFVNIKKGGVLWSSNNSVTVDAEFWEGVRAVEEALDLIGSKDPWVAQEMLLKLASNGTLTELQLHAHRVFSAICHASYFDGTGEPGLINVDRLTQNDEGIEALLDGDFAESQRFKLDPQTKQLTAALAKVFATKPLNMIVNPCGEIPLSLLGGYCVIADWVPFHAGSQSREGPEFFLPNEWDDDAEAAIRAATRALIRVNTMDCLYSKEVRRTNRIGVGFTGIHEYAWARFGYGWKDLVNEQKSLSFWKTMARFSCAAVDEARTYSAALGVPMPHTVTTVKPAGTTSKLFGLSEGAHLPSMREYLRWVQFRNDDPLIEEYRAKGYPVRQLKTYSGTTIVGFPTVPQICTLGMGDKLVTAAEATPEEQYEFLRLLEKYWLHGDGAHQYGGQVSYTLKYDPKTVDFEHFRRTLLEGQSTIKCCSVMPQTDATSYEYQPEEPVSKERFDEIVAAIKTGAPKEDVGFEHVDCSSGSCPVDFLGSER